MSFRRGTEIVLRGTPVAESQFHNHVSYKILITSCIHQV